MLKHALQYMDEIKARAAGRRVAFFLDYDGTLTPIVNKPELAVLSQTMRTCLEQLCEQHDVAIVSGRALTDVRRCVGLDTLYYAGNHGLEIVSPGQDDVAYMVGSELRAAMDAMYHHLQTQLGDITGVLIEHKTYTLSVHYRLVDEHDVSRIEHAVKQVISQHTDISMHGGKKVFELRATHAWNKGDAVCYLLEKFQHMDATIFPIYVGDDVTDEDAFRAVQDAGAGILVAHEIRQTAADFYVSNTDDVLLFLKKFIT
jgi:trehalose 6-phosphate phosphatase